MTTMAIRQILGFSSIFNQTTGCWAQNDAPVQIFCYHRNESQMFCVSVPREPKYACILMVISFLVTAHMVAGIRSFYNLKSHVEVKG